MAIAESQSNHVATTKERKRGSQQDHHLNYDDDNVFHSGSSFGSKSHHKLTFIPDNENRVPSRREIIPPLIILILGLISFSYGVSCTYVYFTEESYVLIPATKETLTPDPTNFPNYVYGPPTLALGMTLMIIGGTILIDLANWTEILFAKITVCCLGYFQKSNLKW